MVLDALTSEVVEPFRSPRWLLLAALVGVAVGWATGFWMRGARNSSATVRVEEHVDAPRGVEYFNRASPPASARGEAGGNNARSNDDEREEAADFEVVLHAALAITDDTDRNVRLRDIARSIDIADLPAAAERARRLGSMERWQVQQALGARWAESDPKGAAAFALKSGGTRWGWDPLLNAVLDKWATTDLPSVTTWLGELPAGKRSNLTASLVTSLARREPESALRLVESQPGAQQNYWLYRQIFEQWAQRDPAIASAAAQNLKSGASRDQAIQAVVAGWTNDNPEAAIAWTKTFDDQATRAKLLNTIAGTWAEVDAKATLAWTRTIEDPRLRQQLFNSTLARIAVNDTSAAQNELRSLPAGQERDNAVNQVMSTVAQQDTKGAFGFLDLLPEGHAREVATANLVSQMARVDPQAAGERLLTLPVAQVTDLAGRIASVMATENLQTAIEWTRNLPEGQARKNAMNGICSAWAQYAPREAAEWMLKEQPGADISSVVGAWAANAPNDVLAWARTLTDGDTKRGAMTMVVQALTGNNAAEARSVFSRDLTPEAQAAAAPQLAQALAKRDLAATRAWAETLPQGPARDGALAGVVREWADQDARAAAGWIEKIPVGESRDMVVTQFATTVMRRDPESAIAWAASISEPELRSTQLEQLANRWMQSDAGAARQWVNQSNILSEAAKHRVLNQRPVRGNYYYTAYGQFFE